ncbi:MAG TPA: RNA ligase family protein [Leptospiraceae bacterium]|nr:RNA ligase family protein [Leptospiraceae bacterium]
MEHFSYPKISDNFQEVASRFQWTASEKIHGANTVIGTDGRTVRIGKRKQWLEETEPFFGWQILRSFLEQSALSIFSSLKDAEILYLYGEIFGGEYPHPDVQNIPSITAVQTGIWYSPDIRFALFDLLKVKNGKKIFLSFTEMEKLASEAGMLTVPKIASGSLNELQSLPVRYISKMPSILGLPAIQNNYAEGFVLKPDAELNVSERPILKVKIPEFQENRFDESTAFNKDAMPSLNELIHFIKLMINPARLASAKSKVGENPSAVIEETVLDVMIDLEKVFPLRMQSVNSDEEMKLKDAIIELIDEITQ